jgi:rare lipoprotein A
MKILVFALIVLLAGCSAAPPRGEAPVSQRGGGGFYKDDGPGDKPPANLDAIADAVPRNEPLHRAANRPYERLGRKYTPLTSLQPYRERGVASWYGRRYHGNQTSIGETYDMYAMTAAHPTLPLPSYARVTSVANGRSVVVRVNDRGPFLHGRIIDLSYVAAHKLGIVQAGSGEVEVEAVVPGAAQSATPPAIVPAPAQSGASAVYVQLGAFSSRDNAEALRERVSRDFSTENAQLVESGSLWRLQIGPYASREAANAAADSVEKRFDVKAHLVVK